MGFKLQLLTPRSVLLFLLMALSSCIRHASPAETRFPVTSFPAQVPEQMFNDIMEFVPAAMQRAAGELNELLHAEARLASRLRQNKGRQSRHFSSFRNVQGFSGSTPYGKHLSYPSFVQTKALSFIKREFDLSSTQMRQLMSIMPKMLHENPETMMPHDGPPQPNPMTCPYPQNVVCNPSDRFRTYDARCNNLRKPLWGVSHQPLSRFLPPFYADGISAPRVSVSGRSLPSARLVSAVVLWDINRPDHLRSLLFMQYGQFLDHDMSKTAISKITTTTDGMGMKMEDVECGSDGCQTSGMENRACFPIEVARNDTDFSSRPCLMFVRSQETPNEDCTPGPREQLNQLTSYLDASHIYGSTEKEALDLREVRPDRGRLQTTPHPAGPAYKPMLPQDPNFKMCRGDNQTLCFKAGDGRVNENSGITIQHAVWVREHNRLEEILHRLNPHWDGERLFQETRRLVGALWQFCVYNEFLPVALGYNVMQAHGMRLLDHGYWNGYQDNVYPNIANSFATAAMRFGHTLVQGTINGRDPMYNVVAEVILSTQFRQPQLLYNPPRTGFDMMALGYLGDSTQTRDQFITKQLSRHLFANNPPNGLGEDLMSINMQRGREHGLPGYNYYREWCGLKKAATFDDLVELPPDVVSRFKLLYTHVDDIDLWPAGVSEISHGTSLLGPTFTCILARQYRNLKFADRFWFENNVHNPYPFTEAQLAEIRKFRYSRLMCNNADYMPFIQQYAFLLPLSDAQRIAGQYGRSVELGELEYFYAGHNNERVPCDSLPDISLDPWREQPTYGAPIPVQPIPLNPIPLDVIPIPSHPQPSSYPQPTSYERPPTRRHQSRRHRNDFD